MDKITNPEQLIEWKEEILSRRPAYKKTIVISSGTCGQASGSLPVIDTINEELEKRRLKDTVGVEITGCHGFCEMEPNIIVYPEEIFYGNLESKDIPEIIERTVFGDEVLDSYIYEEPQTGKKSAFQKDIPFYGKQMRLLTGNNFRIDPRSIEDYIRLDGYQSLAKVLFDNTSEEVIQEVEKSCLMHNRCNPCPSFLNKSQIRVVPKDDVIHCPLF